jgi:two-component system cell cycle response regulator DivK
VGVLFALNAGSGLLRIPALRTAGLSGERRKKRFSSRLTLRCPIQEGEGTVYNYTSINDFTAPSEEKPLRILYIEDYPDNRMLIRRVLMAEGYDVLEAGDAHQALKLALADPPDLILMDINLPEVDGYTLTARIRATPRLAHIPVVALTANVMKGDRERVLEAGCDGYIQKPVDIDQLPWQISKYLRKSRGT